LEDSRRSRRNSIERNPRESDFESTKRNLKKPIVGSQNKSRNEAPKQLDAQKEKKTGVAKGKKAGGVTPKASKGETSSKVKNTTGNPNPIPSNLKKDPPESPKSSKNMKK